MRARTALRRFAIACGFALLLLLGLILSAPLWIDAGAVKAQVVALVNKATDGQARIGHVDLDFLPRPGVALANPAFFLPGKVEFEAKSASIELDFLALLMGKVHPRSLRIDSPKIRVQLPEAGPEARPGADSGVKAISLQQAEQKLRDVVDTIFERAQGANAEIVEGNLELRIGRRPPLILEHLAVELGIDGDALALKLSCGSELWEKLALEARLTRKDLVGEGRVRVLGLSTGRIAAVMGFDALPVSVGDVAALLRWRMQGLADAQGEATVSAPGLTFQSGNRRLEASGPLLQASARIDKGAKGFVSLRVALDTPHLEAMGALGWNKAEGYSLEMETRDTDIPTALATARDLAPEVDWLARPPVRVERGTITSLNVSSRGETLEALLRPAALEAAGELGGVDLRVPELSLTLQDVSATASLAFGKLRIQQIAARAGKSSLSAGEVVMNLFIKPMPVHAEAALELDLAESLALTKGLLRNRDALQYLDQVKRLDGRARVQVTVGESIDRLRPRVDVSALQASLEHEAIPFPIRIVRSRLTYADDAVAVQGLNGSIGESTFADIGARLTLIAPHVVSQGRGSAVLALEEWFRWASAQPDLEKHLEGVNYIAGGLGLTLSRLEGPLDSPKELQFRVAATPKGVRVEATKIGPQVALDGGAIDLAPDSIDVKGVRVSALDANLEIGGYTDHYLQGIDKLNVTVSGTVGPGAQEWGFGRAGVPERYRLRDAVTLSGVSADWSKSGHISARGNATIVGGPAIGFSASHTPKRMTTGNFTVRDVDSDASLGGSLEGTLYGGRFKGRLAGTSIGRVFVRPPVEFGILEGDIQGNGDWKNPGRGRAAGFLNGSDIRLPAGLPDPLILEHIALKAQESVVVIQSARLASGESRVDIAGSIDRAAEKYQVDADIRGDTVVIATQSAKDKSKPKAAEPEKKPEAVDADAKRELGILEGLPLAGEVRVDIRHLRIGRFEIAPLVGSASLKTGRLDLRIKDASLCGITLSGGLSAKQGILDLKAGLRSRDAELESSIACLTEKRLRMTGRFDLDGEFSTSGERAALLDAAQGKFSMVSRNGRIDQFEALGKVFELLNVSEAVEGNLPDLKKKGMPYKTAQVKGRIKGATVFLDEAVLDASAAKVAAQGQVNIGTRNLDVNVLVAPLQTANKIVDKIPILRHIMGGTVLALPVQLRGTVDSPFVVPLGPKAVASRMVDLLANTLKLPADLVNTVSPAPAKADESPKK
jgi:hypothetical protein